MESVSVAAVDIALFSLIFPHVSVQPKQSLVRLLTTRLVCGSPSGNGPSGICLSYLLAGNWPHYTGAPHPGDDMLTARLRYSVATQTDEVVTRGSSSQRRRTRNHCLPARCSKRDDLEGLASGLEGRNAGKPLSLLMDQLQHPCLDAGLDVPSLLDWVPVEEHDEHKFIDHVVLGKGPPGGAWHVSTFFFLLHVNMIM